MIDTPTSPLLDRSSLENEFGNYTPPSPPEALPSVPFQGLESPSPAILGSEAKQPSALEALEADIFSAKKTDSKITGGGIPRSLAEVSSNRFENFVPGAYDNEDAYGQGQGWASKMVSGVGKGLVLTGTTFLQSTAGMVNGVAKWSATGKFSSFYDNEMNRSLDELNKKMEDLLPNYYTNAERDAHWYSPKKLLSANFIWDGVVKNLGFSAGAALAGMTFAGGIGLVSKALSQIPTLGKLVSIGKAAEAIAATEEGILAAGKAAEITGKVRYLSDKFLGTYNALNPGQRILVAGLATTGEAGFEAYQNLNQFRDARIQDYKDNHHGMAPVGADLEAINREADGVGNSSFALNTALLSATNYIQFPKILGSSYKVEQGMVNSIARETGEIVQEAGKFIEKKGMKGIVGGLNKVRPYLFSASEAFEEGAQYAVQVGTQDYYNKKYNNINADFFDSIAEGVSKTLSTDEGMENVMIGGLSGALMMGKGRFTQAREKAKNTADALTQFNKHYSISDFTKDTMGSITRGTVLQQEREDLLKKGDISGSKDVEADYILNYLSPRIKYGRYDLVRSDIETAKIMASTDEGFAQLQSEGKALLGDTKEAYLQRLSTFEQTAENVKSLYQSLHLRYGSQADFTPAVMEKLVYAASKVADYDKRIASLSADVAIKGVAVDQIINDVIVGNDDSYTAAIAEIDNLVDTKKILEEDGISLKTSLADIAKMSLYRNKFLEEYSAMKKAPKKYQDIKEPEVAVDETGKPIPGKVITVADVKGDREVTVGEEYYLGAIDYTDKDGIKKKRFPRITILGESEDGKTITIKDGKGEVRNISKDELKSYQLGKVADVEKSENSSYYFRNVIKQPDNEFFWNLGQKHKSKEFPDGIIPGTLKYDAHKDKLYFVYIQSGKQKTKEIGIDMFTPKGEFKQGVFFSKNKVTGKVNDVTAEDLKNINDRKTSGKTKQDQISRRGNRLAILSDLYNELYDKQQRINKLITAKKDELHNINTGLDLLVEDLNSPEVLNKKSKTVTFNALGKKYLAAARRLSVAKEQLEKELIGLEAQKNDIENAQFYITEMADDIDLDVSGKEFLEELEDQIILLDDLAQETERQMDGIRGLIQGLNKAIDAATDAIRDFIQKFHDKFSQGEFISMDQTYLDIVNNPNFFQGTPEKRERVTSEFNEDLLALNVLIAEAEDFEITPNQEKLKFLKSQLTSLENDLETMEAKARALDLIYDRFKKIEEQHKEQKAQEAKLLHNQALKEEYIGTHSTDVQSEVGERNHYEPNPKKTNEQVVNSTITSDSPHQARSDRFANRFQKFKDSKKESIKWVDVTETTQDEVGLPGLMRHMLPIDDGDVKASTTIAAVFVNAEGKLINEFGEPLTPEQLQNPLEHAIYQVRPLPKADGTLQARYPDSNGHMVLQTMFRDVATKEQRANLEQQYIERRKSILAQKTLGPRQSFTASFGTPEYVMAPTGKVKNGVPETTIDHTTRTSVSEANLVSEAELGQTQVIEVLTTNPVKTEGSVTFRAKLGAVLLRIPGIGLAKLFNRKFSEKEATVMFDVIHQITKIAAEKGTVKDDPNALVLFNWLKSVVYWGIAKDPDTKKRKDPGYNSIWFEDVLEDGKYVPKLFISGKSKNGFSFTPEGLLTSKADIIALIQELYSNTDASLVAAPTSKVYSEIIGIDKNGIPIIRKWNNYQTYLLSDKTSDGLSKRDNAEIPMVTRFRPVNGTDDFNRKSIYFTLNDSVDDYITQQTAPPAAPVVVVTTPTAPAAPTATPVVAVLDGTTVNETKWGKAGVVQWTLDAKKAGQLFKDTSPDLSTPEAIGNFTAQLLKDGIFTFKEISQDVLNNRVAAGQSIDPSALFAAIINKYKPEIVAEAMNASAVATNQIAAPATARPRSTPINKASARKRILDNATKFTAENWQRIEAILKKEFPNIPLYRVKNAILNSNGEEYWGMLQDGAIYLEENAEEGTIYHEIFEAVWKMCTSPEEQTAVIYEFKARKGSYTDRFGEGVINYSEATNEQIKEELAEEYRDFRMLNKTVAPSNQSLISRIFAELRHFFKMFFTGQDGRFNTQKMFDKIGRGYYAQYNQYDSPLSFARKGPIDIDDVSAGANSEARRKAKDIPATQLNDIVQHMTWSTLTELTKTNQDLFTISRPSKGLYNRLKAEIQNLIGSQLDTLDDAIADGTKRMQDVASKYNSLQTLYDAIPDNWNDIIEKYKEHLKTYQIEFDENDNLILEDEDNSGKEAYQDVRKVDGFRKTHSAIRLLLGTLAYTNDVGEWTDSSIGGVKLLPADQVHITLMNRLHDAVTIDDMLNRLNAIALGNPNYAALYKRLLQAMPAEGQNVNFNKLDQHDIQLLAGFWKAIKKQNADVITVFVLPSGEVIISDSNLNTAAKQAKREMINTIIDVMKHDKTPFFSYNTKAGTYSATNKVKDAKLETLEQYVEFLKNIGIDFNVNDLKQIAARSSNQIKMFKESVDGIRKSFAVIGVPQEVDGGTLSTAISNISTKSLGIDKRLLQLGTIKAIIENPEFESTFFNLNGERTQTYIGPNAASALYDALSKAENINDLANTDYKFLLTDKFTKGSVVLKKIFNLTTTGEGDRRQNSSNIMHPVFVDGTIDEQKGKKKESSKLSHRQRFLQELNLNTAGVFLNLVPGDASIEHAVKMHDDEDPFVSEENYLNKDYLEIFKDYFIAEVALAKDNRRVVGGKNNKDLRFFKAILGDALHNKIMKGSAKISGEELYIVHKSDIDKAVTEFIKREAEQTEVIMRNFGIIQDGIDGLVTEGFALTEDMELTEQSLKLKLETLSVNYIIANIELHKLIYSDPYQYSQELKRTKSFNSPRQSLLNSSNELRQVIHTAYNKNFKEGEIGWTDFTRNFFRSIILTDVLGWEDIPKYNSAYEETDGQGLITLSANRFFGILAGDWFAENELQYLHDIEYEKIAKSNMSANDIEKALAKHEKNNPNIRSTYTPRKPIVSGSKSNGRDYNDIVLHKFALVPVSFRILHQMNPKSNAIKLYNKMQNEKIDYAVYASGSKVGTEATFDLYDVNNDFNTAPFETEEQRNNINLPQGIINVPFSIMGVQSEVPSKDTPKVTQGSQVTKLVTMDMMEAGMPIDYKPTLDFEDRLVKWIAEKNKEKASPLYKEIKYNQKLLEAKQQHGFETLLKKLGIVKTDVGFKISEVDKLVNTLKDEILKREVNDNIIEALEGFEDGTVLLEATPAYQQIRNILYSIADSNVIRPKINGGMKVQISSRLLESEGAKSKVITDDKGNEKTVYVSDVLKFYKNEDGKRVCEIMIGRWFNSSMSDDELLEYFNDTPEGQRILSGFAYRIPTQNKNSIEVFKIAKFLPKDFGDSVVIPAGMIRKTGSDFDIDKLSIYLKNLNDKLQLIEYKGSEADTKAFYDAEFEADIAKVIRKIEKYDTFRETLLEIFDVIEPAVANDNSTMLNKVMTPEQEDFFYTHEKLLQAIIDQGVELNLSPSEYMRQQIDMLATAKEKQFAKLFDEKLREGYVNRMYSKALENEYIESLQRLTSHKLNFDRLTAPNSAKPLENLTKVINKAMDRTEKDYSAVGNLINRVFMSNLRHSFIGGKRAIGIAALGQTGHAQRQRGINYIDTDKLETTFPEDKMWLDDGEIRFREYNSAIIKGKRRPIFAMLKSKNSEDYISDINSMLIDGYVDITNGSWVMELGATPQVLPTAQLLLDLGVPKESVFYFINQPIIQDFLRHLENAGYTWLFNSSMYRDMTSVYQPKDKMVTPITEIPSEADLLKMLKHNAIGKKQTEMTDLQRAQQQFMLGEFLKYAKMAEHSFHVTQATNFDTANINDPYVVFQKQQQLIKARKTILSSVDNLLESSFVGPLKNLIYDVRDAFAEILVSDRSRVRTVMERVLLPYVDLPSRDFTKLAQKAVNDMFDWAMQTDTKVNKNVAKILLGEATAKSAAKEIIEYRDSIIGDGKPGSGKPNHPLYNNEILRSLKQEGGNKGKVHNLYIAGRDNKVYDQNLIIYGFRELKKVLADENNPLYRRLLRLAVLQSGITNSPISFTNLLPFEDFKLLYNETLSSLEEMPNLQNFADVHVFERNNWNSESVAIYKRAKLKAGKPNMYGEVNYYNPDFFFVDKKLKAARGRGELPMMINVSPQSQEGKHDYIVYSWEDKISKALRIFRKKTGNTSHIHKVLMQKVYNDDGSPFVQRTEGTNREGELIIYEKYIYKAINAWGDSYKAQEFYDKLYPVDGSSTLAQPSVLDNGFYKVEASYDPETKKRISGEVEDAVVVGIYEGNVAPTDITKDELLEDYSQTTGQTMGTINQINFKEEQSSGYRERTIKNASADATIALAVDFSSAGEKLTKSSVLSQNKKYISVDANTLAITKQRVDGLVHQLNSVNAKTLNIAGNGIYTMKGKYTQEQIDDFTYNLLKQVLTSPNLKTKIESIRTGGQTGFDEAGAKAGIKLGIPTMILAPKGYTFRNIKGQDISSEKLFKDRFSNTEDWQNKDNTSENPFKC